MSGRIRATVVVAVAALLTGPGTSTAPSAPRVGEFDPVPDTPAPVSLSEPFAATAADTFALHSDAGAPYTIYLDFVGLELSGTLWNTLTSILMPIVRVPAWDPDRNGAGFASDELSRIQEIWQRVAADYAPFDVDVTTQDPGSAALVRSGTSDHQYGARALFVGTDAASRMVYTEACGSACGGIAFQASFGDTALTPALIFTGALGPNDPTYIADAASHEIGHTLGLSHDGLYPRTSSSHQEYYAGRAGWGPIMGAPYAMAMTQWSNGSYANASNTQDDVAILANTLGLRPDESGGTPATAVPLGEGTGFVTGRGDVDTYALGRCSGAVQVAASATAAGSDLDLDLQLLSANGTVLAQSDPPVKMQSPTTAIGLDASLTTSVASGSYFVRVGGGGAPANDPYDDYGSLGAYRISFSGGCVSAVEPGTPAPPRSVAATAASRSASLTMTWQPPADTGSSGVTGYHLVLGHTSLDVGTTTRSHTFSGLSFSTGYVATVAAVNAAGIGAPSGAATRTAARGTAPGRVGRLVGHWHRSGRYLQVTWRRPAYTGGVALTGFRISVDGRVVGTVAASRRAVALRNLRHGRHTVKVRALNSVGASPATRRIFLVPRG